MKTTNVRKFVNRLWHKPYLITMLFVIVGVVALIAVNAASPATSYELEAGQRTGNISPFTNASASGGSAIKYGSATTAYAPFTVVAGGDIGKSSDRTRQAATGALIKRISPSYVLALGDLAYENGSDSDFALNYEPYWGSVIKLQDNVTSIKDITRPTPGNHEYYTTGATGYFKYFDPANTKKYGESYKGWYSLTKDNWLFLNLDSECEKVTGGCANGSPQATFVDQQLAANPTKCVIASWHKPRATAGRHSDSTPIDAIWDKIVARKGLVLTGHNHIYTRSYPLNGNAQRDDANGIIQFVIGSGGVYADQSSIDAVDTRQVITNGELGLLKLVLSGNTVKYDFIQPIYKTNTTDKVLDTGTITLGCPGT